MHASALHLVLALALVAPVCPAFAQTDSPAPAPDAPKDAERKPAVDRSDPHALADKMRESTGIEWQMGPSVGHLGTIAEIKIPEGFLFADARGTKQFMELTHNPPRNSEIGTLLPIPDGGPNHWFVVFSYEETGHVKDDDRNELDADALLATLKEGTQQGNAERERRGWSKLELVGWEKPPFYDPKTNNLTWATIARDEPVASKDESSKEAGADGVNWSTRLLGRRGAMSVDLVLSKSELPSVLPDFEKIIGGFSFVSGERYAEFQPGDKIAKYGLAALVAGGAGLVAAKTGLLAKLLKPLAIGLIAVGAFFKRIWSRLFGSKPATDDSAS
jgi:uncharacterized membrane-anchored protein